MQSLKKKKMYLLSSGLHKVSLFGTFFLQYVRMPGVLTKQLPGVFVKHMLKTHTDCLVSQICTVDGGHCERQGL